MCLANSACFFSYFFEIKSKEVKKQFYSVWETLIKKTNNMMVHQRTKQSDYSSTTKHHHGSRGDVFVCNYIQL